MALDMEVHYALDLATDPGPIETLCAALVDIGLGPQVRVLRYERDRGAVEVDLRDPPAAQRVIVEQGCSRGPLFSALQADVPPRHPRRFGEVMLRGPIGRTWLKVRFDEYVPAMPMGGRWMFSNSISVHVDRPRLASAPADEALRNLLHRLVDEPQVLWGAAYDRAEYRRLNLHDEADGMWALGRDMRRSLPGVYWLNAFGPPYVNLIGANTLGSAPVRIAHVGPAILLEVYATPQEWVSEHARQSRMRVLEHIGPTFFFDRRTPAAVTRAPDFGLPELPNAGTLKVFSSDGRTFTVLNDAEA